MKRSCRIVASYFPAKSKKAVSGQRRGLYACTLEGIPAVTIFFLLGGPYLTGYMLYLGASPQQIGIALALPFLANVFQIFAAMGMQYIENRRLTLLIFAGLHRVIWVLTIFIPLLLPRELWVLAYVMMLGFAFISNSIGAVVWTSLVADMVPAQIRGKYFGFRNSILWAAGSLALLLGGYLLDRYPGDAGFQLLYAVCGICMILNIAAFLFYPNIPFEKSKESNMMRLFLLPFKDGIFLKAMLFIALWLFMQGIAVPFYTYVMKDVLLINFSWISYIMMVQNITMMISYYFWGRLNSRYSSRTLLFWSLPIISLSCLMMGMLAFTNVLFTLFLVHVVLGIGIGGFNLMVFNFTIGDTPKSDRPMYVAVFSALTGLFAFLGPLVGGILYETVKTSSFWIQSWGISFGIGAILLLITVTLGPLFLNRYKVNKIVQGDQPSVVS
jgi:MFS family permease